MKKLDALFKPRSVALIGASATPAKWGLFLLHNLLKDGYQGKIYPVGRKGAQALGATFLGSSTRSRGDRSRAGGGSARRRDRRGGALHPARGQGVYVITGGFGETGAAGREVEERLAQISAASGVPIVGPNGQGILNAPLRLCAQMFFTMPPAGNISLVTQSGNIGVALSNLAFMTGIGMGKVVSTGNGAVLEPADFIDYLAQDDETGVVLLYVEGVREGRKLVAALAGAATPNRCWSSRRATPARGAGPRCRTPAPWPRTAASFWTPAGAPAHWSPTRSRRCGTRPAC